jgi:hypothetical protein
MILRYLISDKHSLAQCMQVSPTFNHIAAPILYHTIKLDGTTASLFELPPISERLGESRQTRDKVYNVTNHIDTVDCKEHAGRSCHPRESLSEPLFVHPRLMRFTFADPVVPSKLEAPCSCWSGILPRKLVCHKSSFGNNLIDLLPFCPDLKTAVLRYAPLLKQDVDLIFSGQSIDHLIVIRSKKPVYALEPSPWPEFIWKQFCGVILDAAQIADCPNSITIVNLESIGDRFETREEGYSPAESVTKAVQKAYLDSIPIFAGTSGKKTAEQAQQVKIKFVSMATYLAEYDWKGELTEEEVRPWLDADGKIRARETDGESEV